MTHNDASTANESCAVPGASGNPNEFFDSSLGTLNSEPKRFGWVIRIHDAMGESLEEVWIQYTFAGSLSWKDDKYMQIYQIWECLRDQGFLEMFNASF